MFSPYRIREVMEVQGRRQEWLADQTGYDQATVSRVLNGTTPISTKFAMRTAKALQVPVDWLRDEPVVERIPVESATV